MGVAMPLKIQTPTGKVGIDSSVILSIYETAFPIVFKPF